MIDLQAQLPAIEKLMELMTKHELDEVSCDFINLKKVRHRGQPVAVDPAKLLEPHIAPAHDNEPWMNAVTQDEADKWAAGGGS